MPTLLSSFHSGYKFYYLIPDEIHDPLCNQFVVFVVLQRLDGLLVGLLTDVRAALVHQVLDVVTVEFRMALECKDGMINLVTGDRTEFIGGDQ